MTSNDLIVMFSNLSRSLPAINELLGGFSYLLGTVFCINSFIKFKEILNESGGQNKIIVPAAYFVVGSGLFFLPTLMESFSTTLFGSQDSILSYSRSNQYDMLSSMTMLIQTIGFVWFIRGCVLMGQSSQPEQGQEGSKGNGIKGLLFIIGGLFGINIYSTVNWVNYIVNHIMKIGGGFGA
ncbi:MAG: type IV secretion protein IcmC [Legionellaceae bacterium]|nr:type IV secretion protein IcmC [Legionellaceae bacterium]